MKKKIKAFLIPLIISAICSFVSAKAIYKIYEENIHDKLTSSKIFLVENGIYKSYEDMRKENISNNYAYYKDKNKYKSVIGITKKEENIDKIKNAYDGNILIEEYYISSDIYDDKQKEYDLKLERTNNIEEVKEIINDIISLYKENDTISFILSK